ncbi:AAA family ATPase [uncultured Holdemanella sp.]|uniref:AAA family ATPase n=1 Tax=uncultured Holdemanella sp. TaxID=1763549 RepID=UPI00258CE9A6|nr:AAA family ATPase [uncultured Holdemanella sp.]
MAFSPFARFRNFTLENLKSLLELYPEAFKLMNWDEVGNIIEAEHKGYKKTAYQQACQFGLEDKSEKSFKIQNYLYSFDDSNLMKYIQFWACTYYAPNPYVNSQDESIILFCKMGDEILKRPNLEVDFDYFLDKYIGGKSQDILLNVLKEYCAPLKYKKNGTKQYFYINQEDKEKLENKIKFIEHEFPIIDSKSRKIFFERYSYKNFCRYYNLTNVKVDSNVRESSLDADIEGYNKIYYGIPGCGKSYYIENTVLRDVDKDNDVFRTTFYLDYSNSDFIGQIYPVVKDNGSVSYEEKPGPFTKALASAFKNPDKMIYLVIEEINRGNAAAIFGDTFQLLDRLKEDRDGRVAGDSEYPVNNEFIEEYFKKNNVPFNSDKIYIPHNLTLLATMNTSDQNVFPLDTAFKRRWNREKVMTDWNKVGDIKNLYVPFTDITWGKFATTINNKMLEDNGESDVSVSEDKQMGAYFVKENMLSKEKNTGDKDSLRAFISNVMDYLYNDVTKFNHELLFDKNVKTYDGLYETMTECKSVIDKEVDDSSVGAGKELFESVFKKEIVNELLGQEVDNEQGTNN